MIPLAVDHVSFTYPSGVEALRDVSIEAAGTLKLKASSIKIEGDSSVTINGQTVGIN